MNCASESFSRLATLDKDYTIHRPVNISHYDTYSVDADNPGPMIRCTSIAAPITSPESLSALAKSECKLLVSSGNLEQKETKNSGGKPRPRFVERW